MIAYEIYKERERVYYNLPRDQRYGYKRMLEINRKRNFGTMIINHDAQSLTTYLDLGDRARRWGEQEQEKRSQEQGKTRERN